jgi:hypothetical protein
MADGSTSFLNSRLNVFINNYHENLNALGFHPYFYLEGWLSRSKTHLNNKH